MADIPGSDPSGIGEARAAEETPTFGGSAVKGIGGMFDGATTLVSTLVQTKQAVGDLIKSLPGLVSELKPVAEQLEAMAKDAEKMATAVKGAGGGSSGLGAAAGSTVKIPTASKSGVAPAMGGGARFATDEDGTTTRLGGGYSFNGADNSLAVRDQVGGGWEFSGERGVARRGGGGGGMPPPAPSPVQGNNGGGISFGQGAAALAGVGIATAANYTSRRQGDIRALDYLFQQTSFASGMNGGNRDAIRLGLTAAGAASGSLGNADYAAGIQALRAQGLINQQALTAGGTQIGGLAQLSPGLGTAGAAGIRQELLSPQMLNQHLRMTGQVINPTANDPNQLANMFRARARAAGITNEDQLRLAMTQGTNFNTYIRDLSPEAQTVFSSFVQADITARRRGETLNINDPKQLHRLGVTNNALSSLTERSAADVRAQATIEQGMTEGLRTVDAAATALSESMEELMLANRELAQAVGLTTAAIGETARTISGPFMAAITAASSGLLSFIGSRVGAGGGLGFPGRGRGGGGGVPGGLAMPGNGPAPGGGNGFFARVQNNRVGRAIGGFFRRGPGMDAAGNVMGGQGPGLGGRIINRIASNPAARLVGRLAGPVAVGAEFIGQGLNFNRERRGGFKGAFEDNYARLFDLLSGTDLLEGGGEFLARRTGRNIDLPTLQEIVGGEYALPDFFGTGDPHAGHNHGAVEATAGMDPRMANALQAMMRDNPRLRVNSGHRSGKEQAALHARGGSPAAPGESMHERGVAADIGPSSEYGWLRMNASKYGLEHITQSEPWHLELRGTRNAREKHASISNEMNSRMGGSANMEGVYLGADLGSVGQSRPGESGLKPHVKLARRFIQAMWGINNIGGVGQRSGPSDHPRGLALDVMVAQGRKATGAGKMKGDSVAQWFDQNPQAFGTKYTIWWQKIASPPGSGWRQMEDRGGDTANHYDHPHLSFRDSHDVDVSRLPVSIDMAGIADPNGAIDVNASDANTPGVAFAPRYGDRYGQINQRDLIASILAGGGSASAAPTTRPRGTGSGVANNLATAGDIPGTILRTGQALGATPQMLLAALETGLVESDMRTGADVAYKDLDSIGVMQQRAAWANEEKDIPWQQSLRNDPAWAARAFFQGGMSGQPGAFTESRRGHRTAGELAQDVQVSRYPHKYNARRGEAVALAARYGVDLSQVADPFPSEIVDLPVAMGGGGVADTSMNFMLGGAGPAPGMGAGAVTRTYGAMRGGHGGGGVHIENLTMAVTLANGGREEVDRLFEELEDRTRQAGIMSDLGGR